MSSDNEMDYSTSIKEDKSHKYNQASYQKVILTKNKIDKILSINHK